MISCGDLSCFYYDAIILLQHFITSACSDDAFLKTTVSRLNPLSFAYDALVSTDYH